MKLTKTAKRELLRPKIISEKRETKCIRYRLSEKQFDKHISPFFFCFY